jgi:hypothetical protein
MHRQLSLLDLTNPRGFVGHLAGLMPALRAAMNAAAGSDEAGRKLLVDKINALASQAGIRLTSGNAKRISKDTLDKWLSPSDRSHTPGLLAVAVFCRATDNTEPLRVLLQGLGLDVMTPEDRQLRDYARACLTEREARKRKKQLEERI